MSDKIELKVNEGKEWIEVFPYGMVVGPENEKPVMVFKDRHEKFVLPVWMSPSEANIAASTSLSGQRQSPHQLSFDLFNKAGIKLLKLHFVEVSGPSQKVELFYKQKGSNTKYCIPAEAENVMSFCLQAKIKFYSSKNNIQQSRDREWEMNAQNSHMNVNAVINNGVITNRKGYLN